MEIRVELQRGEARTTHTVSVTMRTPGEDFELTAGFLFSEGLVASRGQVREITYCPSGQPSQEYNVVSLRLEEGVAFDASLLDRNFYTTSSCGVCGKASLEALEIRDCPVPPSSSPQVAGSLLAGLPGELRRGQAAFRKTGGLHAAGLFDEQGGLLALREDVGRHNAVDKVVGWAFLADRLPLHRAILVVSGRTSFDIMQKALMAGIPVVVAVGAPSSLAVDLARRFGMTLTGFTREEGFNVYAGVHRVLSWEPEEA